VSEKENLTVLVWERAPSRFCGTDLVLLLKLAGLSALHGHAFAGVERLAAMCGVKPRALRYALRELVKAKVLKVQNRKGHSNKYFLQVDEIRKLPLVSHKDADPTAEAVKLATDLEASLRANLSAVIPADWQTTWPAELQKLFDAGHKEQDVRPVILYARKHEWWSNELRKNGAHGLVSNFVTILEHFTKDTSKAA
jgi:hypothetical protein